MLDRANPRWVPAMLAAALTASLLAVAPPGAEAAEQVGARLPGPVTVVGANGATTTANKTMLGISSGGALRHLEDRWTDDATTTVVMEVDPESGEQSYLTTSAAAVANDFFRAGGQGDVIVRTVQGTNPGDAAIDLQRLPSASSSTLDVENASSLVVGRGGAVYVEFAETQRVQSWTGSGAATTLYTPADGTSVTSLAADGDLVVGAIRNNMGGGTVLADISSGSAETIADLGTDTPSNVVTADGILSWQTFGKLFGCRIDDCGSPTELWTSTDPNSFVTDVAIAGDEVLWLTGGEGRVDGDLWRSTSLSVPTGVFFTERGPFSQVETDGTNAFLLVGGTMIRQVPLGNTSAVRTVTGPGFGRPITTSNPQVDGNRIAYEADRRVEFGIEQRAGNLEDIVTLTLASGGLVPTTLMDENGTAARFGGQPGFVDNDIYWLDRRRCGPDTTCQTIADVFRSGFGSTAADTRVSGDSTATFPQLDTGGDAAAWPCTDQTVTPSPGYELCHTTGGAITSYDRDISFSTQVSVEGRFMAYDRSNRIYVFDTVTGNEAQVSTSLASLATDISGTNVLHVTRDGGFGAPEFVTVTDFSSLTTNACNPTCDLSGNAPVDSWEVASGTASITIDGDDVAWTRADDDTFASYTTFWTEIGAAGAPRPLPAATPALFDLDIESNRLFGSLRRGGSNEFDPSADVAAIALPGGAAIPSDTSAPAPATGFGADRRSTLARAAAGSQALSWTNPSDPDFLEVRILRVPGSSPVTSLDDTTATIVYQGTGTSTTDVLVAGGRTYAYSLFAVDTSGNVSPPATLVATPGGGVGPGSGEDGAFRIAGGDRFETAVKTSQEHFPGTVETVFLATGRNFPDALAASASAGSEGSPILLTEPGALPDLTRDELVRLDPDTVVVMGGDVAVSKPVRDAVLAALGDDTVIVRYAGDTRFGTAAQLAEDRFPVGVGIAYVATGRNFPDALAGGLAAALGDAPILLVEKDSVPAETAAALTALNPGRIVVLGGEVAVSVAVADALAAFTDGDVDRISGADRYLTAVAVVGSVFPEGATATNVYVATGTGFPDALAGGPAAARVGAPLLLTPPDGTVPAEVLAEIDRLGATRVVVLGGEVAVSPTVFDQLANAL